MDSYKDDASDDCNDMGCRGSGSDLCNFPHLYSLDLNTVAFMMELREHMLLD